MDDLAGAGASTIIGLESWQKLWPDSRPLMLAHRIEVGQDDPRAPLDPDGDLLKAGVQNGSVVLIGARQREVLVGYSIWFLSPSVETRGLLLAQQGPWYVEPDWRDSGIGGRLWRFAMTELKGRGVDLLLVHQPLAGAGEGLGRMFAKLGGKREQTVWSIWLDLPGKKG